ncbi:MAG: Csp1 family four helix bundle copper storage protein [Deltaproteobacteria bacterium]|nr:Csp1 family four helix bundle copper storage protein [Deltaproteobacteria bacterium]
MSIRRREVMVGAAGILAAGVASSAFAAEGAPSAPVSATALAGAAARCVDAGNECLQHCLDMLSAGDTTLADCAREVRQMVAVCAAAGPMAYAGGKRLGGFARVCADVCGDCEKACRKHEAEHEVCKRCAEACARFIAEARKVAA